MQDSLKWMLAASVCAGGAAVVIVGCTGDDSNGGSADAGAPDTSGGTDGATAPDTSTNMDSATTPDSRTDAGCPASWFTAPAVPDVIAVPSDGGTVFLHGLGAGTQTYTCNCADGGTDDAGGDGGDGGSACAWSLPTPAAQLSDCNGNVFAVHSAPTGPTHPQWQANDGSYVIGHKLNAGITDDAGAPSINWVLLQAAGYGGDAGIMDNVLYIQRLDTDGGLVPTSMVCDEATVATTYASPYTADYYFWGN